jgi:quercetin dioxygenase-like cupin family protein
MSTESSPAGSTATGPVSDHRNTGAIFTVPCADLDRSIGELTSLGFRLSEIGPADAPNYAIMTGNGARLRLDHSAFEEGERRPFLRLPRDPGGFDLDADTSSWLRGPTPPPSSVPKPSFTVSRVDGEGDGGGWHTGRAGMRYRDLIPDRWGGAVIASHINLAEGGPVPDYVHYHHVDFQLIFCHRGWVRVVYQDQGDPFVLHRGDAILQAPGIRHRVLESSSDFYVVEVTSPAFHPTMLDHDLELPNGSTPGRRYGGQDYVHHRHHQTEPVPVDNTGLTTRDLGLFSATNGRFHGYVVEPGITHRTDRGTSPASLGIDDLLRSRGRERLAFTLLFMLDGSATVTGDGVSAELGTDDSVAIPPDMAGNIVFDEGFEWALVLTGAFGHHQAG